jgi:hypothetical protein
MVPDLGAEARGGLARRLNGGSRYSSSTGSKLVRIWLESGWLSLT